MTIQERPIGLLFLLLILTTSVSYSDYTEGNSEDDRGQDPEDNVPPSFTLLSPDISMFHMDPQQSIRIEVSDMGSGVNGTSVEFRMSTRGLSKWSEWIVYGIGMNGTSLTIEIDLIFRRGTNNYLQMRAKDIIGNAADSPIYNIKINTVPVLVITSPIEEVDYFEDQNIVFDASGSYDMDDDGLPSISWVGNDGKTPATIGEDSALVISTLKPGVWTITVIAKDKVGNEVMKTLTLNVLPRPVTDYGGDWDGDGIPNWYEMRYMLKVNENDADEDPDGDGFSNLQEFQNLTSPTGRLPPPEWDNDKKENNKHKKPYLLIFMILFFSFVLIVLSIFALRIMLKNRWKKRTIRRMKVLKNNVKKNCPLGVGKKYPQ